MFSPKIPELKPSPNPETTNWRQLYLNTWRPYVADIFCQRCTDVGSWFHVRLNCMQWRLILSAYLVQLFYLTFVYHWAYFEHIEPENSQAYRSSRTARLQRGTCFMSLLWLLAFGDFWEVGGPVYCAIIRYSNQ